MTHLPECRVRTYTTDDGMVYEVAGDLCICSRLRACEARVEEAMDRAWTHTLRIKQSEAYAAGVQAARDAVEDCRVPWPTATGDLVNEGIDDALAAIQRLLDGPDMTPSDGGER